MKFKLLTLLFLLTCFSSLTFANQYPVTSNADLGSGTLREAIAFANSHPGFDSIVFSLADTSVAGRTITLESPLSDITDRLSIDGTTQAGTPFGISQAKIQLTATNPLIQALSLADDSCEVYGLFIQNFEKGIVISKRYNQIGAVGKGNVIFNCTIACVEIYSTNHVAIISNLIGVDTAQQVGTNVGDGLLIEDCFAVAIGGRSSDGRNILSGNMDAIHLVQSKFVDVNANYIGTDLTGLVAIPNQYGVYGDSDNVNIEIGGDSLYEANLISGNTNAAIYGKYIASTFQGNLIGTDITGTAPLGNGTYGIYFSSGSNTNNVGGKLDHEGNVIANNGSEAIYLKDTTCYQVSVLRNITYCNSKISGNGGFTFNGGNIGLAPPQILIANAFGVSGIALPNAVVDIFNDDTCAFCEGAILVGTTTALSSGVFILEKDVAGTVTGTMTDIPGNTSEYTSCTPVGSITCLLTNFISPLENQCPGTLLQFTDQSISAPGSDLKTWTWNFGDGNTSTLQNPTHTYTSSGTYTITLSVTNTLGCLNSISKSYAVANVPAVAFTSSQPACTGNEIQFTDLSTVEGGDSITSWLWNFGDGASSTDQNPSHAYNAFGTYTVTLTASGLNCSASSNSDVQIFDSPTAAFEASLQVCKDAVVSFTDLSTAGVGDNLTSWTWDFGDGNSSNESSPDHVYLEAGTYTVSLSVTGNSGCSGNYSSTIQVFDFPTAFYSSTDLSCVGSEISFTDASTTGGDDITGWSWDFGDGNSSSDQNPVHSFSQSGDFTVTLTISTSSGCSGQYSSNMNVVDPPSVSYTALATSCVSNNITFTDQSSASNGDAISTWQWNFGDGNSSSEQNPDHSFSQSGTFTVMLSVTTSAGCAGEYSTEIQILDQPVASFNFTQAGLTVTFENTSTDNGNASYSWDFADGNTSTEENPEHQYSSGGVYNVCLTVYDSTCMTSSTTCSIVDLPTGINQMTNAEISVYPNPANDVLVISGASLSGIKTISVMDALGQRMIQSDASTRGSEIKINVGALPQGIYFLELMLSDNSILKKKINVIH